jgi:phosphoribosylglycinamide formyltransferase 1
MNFAVFASGNGSNVQAIIDALKAGRIAAALAVVFSDKPDAFALTRAKKAGIATLHLSPKDFADRAAFDNAVLAEMDARKIDFIVLAGYMRLLSPQFVRAYAERLINIHPSLLPDFKGAHAIRDAFAAKVKETGVSVHFVIDEVDAGRIIAQEKVAILPNDTLGSLEERIHAVEHKLYPQVIADFAAGKITTR